MGLIGNCFPFSSCCSCDGHAGSFLWANVGNVLNLSAGITYIIAWVLVIFIAVVGIIVFPLYLVIWVPLFVWLCLDATAVGIQTVGGVFHVLASMKDEGITQAFTSIGLHRCGVATLSMYNCMLHWFALGMIFFGFGVLVLFGPYCFSFVLLIFAFIAAKNDE